MYATIGFMPIEEVALPPALAARKVTNPDAPRVDVAIKVQTGLGSAWVTPLVHATVDRYDAHQGGEFFKYMKLSWLEVGRGEVRQHAPKCCSLSYMRRRNSGGLSSRLAATRDTSFIRKKFSPRTSHS